MTAQHAKASRRSRSLWTPANIVTCTRVALVPVWLAIAESSRASGGGALAWLTFGLYVVISLTDKLDGYLARSRDEVTTFGKFLDPIADKLAVIVALLFLMEVFPAYVASWVVFVIVARELLVDGLRMVASSHGTVIAAGRLGKWKTAITMIAICMFLALYTINSEPAIMLWLDGAAKGAPLLWDGGAWGGNQVATGLGMLCACLLYVSVVLTVWSGVDYFLKAWPSLDEDE